MDVQTVDTVIPTLDVSTESGDGNSDLFWNRTDLLGYHDHVFDNDWLVFLDVQRSNLTMESIIRDLDDDKYDNYLDQ